MDFNPDENVILDSSEDEYEEIEEEILNIQCLFCELVWTSFEGVLQHINEEHKIDFHQNCKSRNFETLEFIKLVNYIRKNAISPSQIDQIFAEKLYDCDSYLKPVLEDDHFLMFDFENDDDDKFESLNNAENVPEMKEFSDFENYYKSLTKEKLLQDYYLLKLKFDEISKNIETMGELIKQSIADDTNQVEASKQSVMKLNENSDCDYITSYSHFGIHHVMLSDKPRTLSYKDAIMENCDWFSGKSVLDIGCGTGILSLFAAKAGAKIVVAVDQSDIIKSAEEIIRKNGHENTIKTVKGKLETIDWKALNLPTHYDIIISEWMGYFLLFEGMIDTVLYARDHMMMPNGILLPNRSKMFLAAFSDSNFYEKNVDFWNDVYGFSMSSFIEDVTSEAMVELIQEQNICSSFETILDLEISSCSLESALRVHSKFELKFEKTATIHGFVGWFDCYFEGMAKWVVLSTSPFAESTHWKQTVFLLKEPISIEAGRTLRGEIEIVRSNANVRALLVIIYLTGLNMALTYNVSC